MVIGGVRERAVCALLGDVASMGPPMVIGGVAERIAVNQTIAGFNGAADGDRRSRELDARHRPRLLASMGRDGDRRSPRRCCSSPHRPRRFNGAADGDRRSLALVRAEGPQARSFNGAADGDRRSPDVVACVRGSREGFNGAANGESAESPRTGDQPVRSSLQWRADVIGGVAIGRSPAFGARGRFNGAADGESAESRARLAVSRARCSLSMGPPMVIASRCARYRVIRDVKLHGRRW